VTDPQIESASIGADFQEGPVDGLRARRISIPGLELPVDRSRMFVLVGIPGSGKTTYARALLAGAVRISLDDLRMMLAGVAFDPRVEPMVRAAGDAMLESVLSRANRWTFDIVLDATNTTRRGRSTAIAKALQHDVLPVAIYFDVPLAVALVRNRARERRVPEPVMRRFDAILDPPAIDEGFIDVHRVAHARQMTDEPTRIALG
jgi:predicted kinase